MKSVKLLNQGSEDRLMKPPVASVFFTIYFTFWVILGLVLSIIGHSPLGFAFAMLICTICNLIGIVITATTGWAPWKD